jgi:PAS domain S-box-containing protein
VAARKGSKKAQQGRRKGRPAPARAQLDEFRLQTALEAINEGVYDWDVAKGRIHYTDRVYSVLNMPRSVTTPTAWRKRVHPDELAAYDAAIVAHFKNKTSRFECDYRYRDLDGRWRWARQHGIAIRDARGRAIRMIGSTGDITELKRVEQALKDSEERYVLATQAGTEGIYDWDLTSNTLFLSQRAKQFFGIKSAKLTPAAWNERVHPDDFAGYREALIRCFKGKEPRLDVEYRIRNPRGGWRWILDHGAPVRDARGRATRLVGAVSDIDRRKQAELELTLARDEAREALERQTATAEILKVIASSPADVQPVFEAIVRSAGQLFKDSGIGLRLVENGLLVRRAGSNYASSHPMPINRDSVAGACVLTAKAVHLPDLEQAVAQYPMIPQLGLKAGFRSGIYSPLLRQGVAIGTLSVLRRKPGAFSDKELALLQTFADQAVIAIENARLFNETREALEQQRASAEVLGAISGSMSDTQPVFDRILESCERLFAGHVVGINILGEDGKIHLGAFRGEHRERFEKVFPLPLTEHDSGTGAAILQGRVMHYPDVENGPDVPPGTRAGCKANGVKSVIFAPMMAEEGALGAIFVSRRHAIAFTPEEIERLKTFANQAAISVKNVRLFNSTREALERQTATAEILKVIASSPSDVQPVFDAIARSAARLLGGHSGAVRQLVGDTLQLRAFTSTDAEGDAALTQRTALPRDTAGSLNWLAINTRKPAVREDVESDPELPEAFRQMARARGFRSNLAVPMLRDGTPIGTINVPRRQPGGYPAHQIKLLETFADQAVIAIENVRLFNETKEALERQTATAEILQSMSSTMTDAQPVFDAIVRNLRRLFGTRFAVVNILRDGKIELPAVSGEPGFERLREFYPRPYDKNTAGGTAMSESRVLQFAPVSSNPEVPHETRVFARDFGFEGVIFAPMVRKGEPIGYIATAHREPKSFNDAEVALIRSFANQAAIAIENVRLFNETREALEQQTATAEILKVIAGSPSDVQPVFEAIVHRAGRLAGGCSVNVTRLVGDKLHLAAYTPVNAEADEALRKMYPVSASEARPLARAVRDKAPFFVADFETDPGVSAIAREVMRKRGYRSTLYVPIVQRDVVHGVMHVSKVEPGPFPEDWIALLKIFADQAVIAIENVRLFNETKEALERQTATAEILKVIASSPSDVQPVFDAIANTATRLLGGHSGAVRQLIGDTLVLKAFTSTDPEGDAALKRRAVMPKHEAGSLNWRAIKSCRPEMREDFETDPAAPESIRQMARARGFRSNLAVPMLRDGVPIGTISVARRQPGQYPEHQVHLLQTFADQAVIAIENVRLFNETKDSLERQTATAEILKVIARSTSDVQPVFDVIVSTAVRLCRARYGRVYRYDGATIQMVAGQGLSAKGLEKVKSVFPRPASDDTIAGRVILGGKPFFINDAQTQGDIPSLSREMIEALSTRSQITVPMLRSGVPIGALTLGWENPGAFNDQQVALLQTFADQAVIAVENVRLFNETEEALERQTATAAILRVISDSPDDVQPVFRAVCEQAAHICEANVVDIVVADGAFMQVAATYGELGRPIGQATPLDRTTVMGRSIVDRLTVHVADLQAEGHEFPRGRELALKYGHRTIVGVPLVREGKALGTILLRRPEVKPFDEKHLSILRTFADQAAIAIENVRLFNETRESLERQTATAEVLKVISSSPTDVQPVFDAIASSAKRLLNGGAALVARRAGDMLHLAAYTRTSDEGDAALQKQFPSRIVGKGHMGKAVLSGSPVWIPDIEADPDYSEAFRAMARARGLRSIVSVPMLRDGEAIGVISVNRPIAGRFSDHQTSLLKTFADQAVIAIENVRLFNETKESLERQTATAEILRVIASSPADVQPVFEAIARSAVRLFGMYIALRIKEGDRMIRVAELSPDSPDIKQGAPTALNESSYSGRAILRKQVMVLEDFSKLDWVAEETKKLSAAGGFRSAVFVPMMRDNEAIGAIGTMRKSTGPFPQKQIELLQIFANQAVIAIENVRLFNETKESLERQTATAEILRVIASSPADVQPVFDAIAASARRILAGNAALVARRDGDILHLAAHTSTGEAGDAALKKLFPTKITGQGHAGKAILSAGPVWVGDVNTDEAYSEDYRVAARARGFRSVVSVPMLREGEPIGVISVYRPAAGSFTDHQTNLLKTFADQAVIAIENVRLFNETKESLERQTATAEILRVISSSPTDVQPVFDAITQAGLKLFPGSVVLMTIPRDAEVHAVAAAHDSSEISARIMSRFPIPLRHTHLHGAAILDSRMIDLPDAEAGKDGLYGPGVQNFLATGLRAMTIVPLLHGGRAIGALSVARVQPGVLGEKQVALLRTFADQAVIAIENVRLFKELKQRVEQMTALREVGQAISSTLELDDVLQTVVTRAVQLTNLDGGAIYEYDTQGEVYNLKAAEKFPEEFVETVRRTPIRKGDGATGRTAVTLQPVQVADIMTDDYLGSRREILERAGYRAILAVPLLREDTLVGALMVMRKSPGEFPAEVVELLRTFAAQSALAIQNARLFREIAEKGKQLEEASRHKSNFLASMSHELRTPLNAILGFNEMILDEVYGEVSADVKAPLENIQSSGKHLLRLINNVLDLAKIESGRMELALADYSVHDTVASVRSTLQPLAEEKELEFLARMPDDLPLAYGDGGRIAQCLINLGGNSLKFTKAGKVEIAVAQQGELLRFSVSDTGMGIAPDKISSLFTEFKQTDATIATEYGGTGLGLSITRKFVEMHGGRIWVESEPGKGSTFTFEIPLRVAQ